MSSEAGGPRESGGEKDSAGAEGGGATARQAPTEQQKSEAGTPKRFASGQTVCNERNEKGKLCNGHLKQLNTQHAAEVFLRGDDTLHRCQTCGALYSGPPLGHVRDPRKQRRYVERDLAAILRAAGGTLPAYDYPEPGWRDAAKSDALSLANSNYEMPASPSAGPSSKKAGRAVPDSSPSADRHRPAAEAQAATGQASAAPLSPAAATASPAAGAETVSDLAPEASTELTPGAPPDGRRD